MSYYMTGANGLGQDMLGRAQRRATIYRPGGTIYRGGVPNLLSRPRATHGFGIAIPQRPPKWAYGAGAGPYVAGVRRPMHGFGQDPNSVCSDWQAGGSGDNAAGNRAASAIQAQLNNQGFGPIAVDGIFGSESISAWNRFADANPGVTRDWPDCSGITTLFSGGAKGGASKASMALGLGLLALLAIGAAALLSKKKHGAKHHHAGGTDKLIIEEHRS